jgi:exopolyphosphatase/pppGpp-phosphohydrolase
MVSSHARLKEALATGNRDLVLTAATVIIQSVWRVKKARTMVIALKAEKEQVILESAAKKIQKLYRMRVALRKRSQQLSKQESKNMMRK